MQAKFGMERELHNKLFYKECENDNWDFHFHSQIELCFIDDGELEVLINDKKRVLKKDEMSVALSFDAHAYKPIKYSKSSVLIIPPYICDEFISTIKHKKVVNPFICDYEVVKKIKAYFNQIKEEANEIILIGYIYLILGIIIENICFEPSEDLIEPEVSSKILLYIHENFKNNITLSSLSSTFGYSQSYISKQFKSCFNIGINRYLRIIRLKNVIMLMNKNKYSTTYCALESGFSSLGTFYRVFYNEFNCTPKDYLKEINS